MSFCLTTSAAAFTLFFWCFSLFRCSLMLDAFTLTWGFQKKKKSEVFFFDQSVTAERINKKPRGGSPNRKAFRLRPSGPHSDRLRPCVGEGHQECWPSCLLIRRRVHSRLAFCQYGRGEENSSLFLLFGWKIKIIIKIKKKTNKKNKIT